MKTANTKTGRTPEITREKNTSFGPREVQVTFRIFAFFFAFCCFAIFAEPSRILGATGKVTIEKEGRPPTEEELEITRSAVSNEYEIVQISPSKRQIGFKANPVVDAAAAVAAYREGGSEPYLFRMFFPKKANPKKKYPLVLWLHGFGESISDNKCQLAHMQTSIDVLAGPNRPDFYLAAVQCPVETCSWHEPDPRTPHGETPLEMLDKIIQALVEEYQVDENRISLLGICSGGNAAFELIKKFPKRFSAIAVCSAESPSGPPRTYRHQPIWLFNSREDTVARNNNLNFADGVNRSWGDVFVTLIDSDDHNTWRSAQRDDHVIEWLLRQRQGRFAFPRNVPVLNHSKGDVLRLFVLPMAVFFAFTAAALRRRINARKTALTQAAKEK